MNTSFDESVDQIAAQKLEQLGYQQELKRSRGLIHTLFMNSRSISIAFGLTAPIATSLVGGGPATMIWGWVLLCIFSQPLALSLAEICSKYPTSGGAYYWCFRLASPRHRRLLSWINGWLTMVGVWTSSLSVIFGTAQLIVAEVGIFRPEWIATPWETYLIYLGITLVAGTFAIFFNHKLPTIEILSACWTILGLTVMLICLSVKAQVGRHPASFALGHFDPSASGWNPGWTFFIGLLPFVMVYSLVNFVAMSEEVHNPSIQVPKAIALSVPVGAIYGLVLLLPIVFTLPDITTLLAAPGGQPIGIMFELIMGSRGGGFGMWFIILIVGIFCSISISCAASRATWSFARDRAIPFHKTISKVNHRLGDVPMNAYILSTGIQVLLALIFLGSSTAFNAFVGVAVICLGASYAMPVAILLLNGRKDMANVPFPLGKWGPFLNAFSILWVCFLTVLSSMPAVIPVTKVSMNYASVVFVGFGGISAVWYLLNGRLYYNGPRVPEED
ncbi:amino acid transporter [Crucibulum laeve]|uniref:Amino acid transporter n=1 Tax=Crucibulum laeve TaxID=68775 RepID=A0A5C3LT33_9AGAR|nr:amino acid transporter [Crucibulum laeve]